MRASERFFDWMFTTMAGYLLFYTVAYVVFVAVLFAGIAVVEVLGG